MTLSQLISQTINLSERKEILEKIYQNYNLKELPSLGEDSSIPLIVPFIPLFEKLYFFKNKNYLNYLFYSGEAVSDRMSKKAIYEKKRLEFLGDDLVKSFIVRMLYKLYPRDQEGTLTKKTGLLISGDFLDLLGKSMGLLYGFASDTEMSKRSGMSLRDAVHAYMASVYLDGGLEKAFDVWKNVLKNYIENKAESSFAAKTAIRSAKVMYELWDIENHNMLKMILDQRLFQVYKVLPTYIVRETTNSANKKEYDVELYIYDFKMAYAKGTSIEGALESLFTSLFEHLSDFATHNVLFSEDAIKNIHPLLDTDVLDSYKGYVKTLFLQNYGHSVFYKESYLENGEFKLVLSVDEEDLSEGLGETKNEAMVSLLKTFFWGKKKGVFKEIKKVNDDDVIWIHPESKKRILFHLNGTSFKFLLDEKIFNLYGTIPEYEVLEEKNGILKVSAFIDDILIDSLETKGPAGTVMDLLSKKILLRESYLPIFIKNSDVVIEDLGDRFKSAHRDFGKETEKDSEENMELGDLTIQDAPHLNLRPFLNQKFYKLYGLYPRYEYQKLGGDEIEVSLYLGIYLIYKDSGLSLDEALEKVLRKVSKEKLYYNEGIPVVLRKDFVAEYLVSEDAGIAVEPELLKEFKKHVIEKRFKDEINRTFGMDPKLKSDWVAVDKRRAQVLANGQILGTIFGEIDVQELASELMRTMLLSGDYLKK